jgi:hypothetical protein
VVATGGGRFFFLGVVVAGIVLGSVGATGGSVIATVVETSAADDEVAEIEVEGA